MLTLSEQQYLVCDTASRKHKMRRYARDLGAHVPFGYTYEPKVSLNQRWETCGRCEHFIWPASESPLPNLL